MASQQVAELENIRLVFLFAFIPDYGLSIVVKPLLFTGDFEGDAL
jgi:hypothetical protein